MNKEKLMITEALCSRMVEHGRLALPYEACGLLSGNDHEICTIWQLQNEYQSSKRFFVSKRVIEEKLIQIKYKHEHVLAIYHSHPNTAPTPSYYDIIHHPDNNVKMVIISYKRSLPVTKCYRIHNNTYEECLFSIK